MSNNELAPSVAKLVSPWDHNQNTVLLATSLSLQRNIEKFKFPGKMTPDRRQQVVSITSKGLTDSGALDQAVLLKGDEISPLDKEYLMEHFLSLQSFQHAHVGEGFVVDNTGTFIASFNLNNHIHFTQLDTENDLEKAWNTLVKIESTLGEDLGYAFSPKFGFLTADPHQCGTGFNVSAFLQLPALAQTNELEPLIRKLQDDQLIVTGIQGSPTEIIGDVIVIQNNYTLGITEDNILSTIRSAITKVQVQENAIRLKLKEQDKPEIKDHVARAYAVLVHSYQIETIEALNNISLLKLGVDLGWISGITTAELNHLFFSCRRAHLLGKISSSILPEELSHKRAEHIHKALTKITLGI
ncbi:MAG: protein arginine kinase [Parachlamydiales bacterium]|jgi:protein arginine kinase